MATHSDLALNSNRIKHIDPRNQHIVYGFIRESETALLAQHDQHAFYHIPDLITVLCLLFYDDGEVFGDVSSCMAQSGINKNTITSRNEETGWYCAFGKQWYESTSNGIIMWHVKFLSIGTVSWFAIGLISNKHSQDTEEDFDTKHSYYFCPNGVMRVDGNRANGRPNMEPKVHDTLTLIANLNTKVLSIRKNDGETRALCDIETGPDIQYRFALSMNKRGTQVAIAMEFL